jgi:hypothetical protein
MKPIKGTRSYEFDDLPTPTIELDLDWSYYHDAGKFYGPMEDCYPPETEAYAELQEGWEKAVVSAYLDAAKTAIAAISKQVEGMNADDIEEWADEERGDYLAAQYDHHKDARRGL